jgi:threonine dehydrogenase-like Zn-dependent dehydrogenase
MRGLFIVERDKLAFLDMPIPAPGPFEARVRVLACGICNSTDRKLMEGEFCPGPWPALLGHESVGQVVEIGARVTAYGPGDLVLRPGLTDAQVGIPGARSVWGGFAEYGLVRDVWAERGMKPDTFAHPQQLVPGGTDPCMAVAMITLKETMSCLRSTEVPDGGSLGIVGTGPVAEALAFFARLAGIAPVVVFGRSHAHGERLTRAGADAYVTGGEPSPCGPLDRVIEAVGSRAALARAIEACAPEGRVNVYGVAPGSEPYDQRDMADPRVFVGKVAEAEEHDALLGLLSSGRVSLGDWVDRVLPWTDFEAGFDLIARRQARKVVLRLPEP